MIVLLGMAVAKDLIHYPAEVAEFQEKEDAAAKIGLDQPKGPPSG